MRIASSEPIAGQTLGGSSVSEARSAEAAGCSAAKVARRDLPAPDAPGQLEDMLQIALHHRCLSAIGNALLEYGISELREMLSLLEGLEDEDFDEDSRFRRELPLTKFQVRTLCQWKKELEPKPKVVIDLTEDNVRVKPERPSP